MSREGHETCSPGSGILVKKDYARSVTKDKARSYFDVAQSYEAITYVTVIFAVTLCYQDLFKTI